MVERVIDDELIPISQSFKSNILQALKGEITNPTYLQVPGPYKLYILISLFEDNKSNDNFDIAQNFAVVITRGKKFDNRNVAWFMLKFLSQPTTKSFQKSLDTYKIFRNNTPFAGHMKNQSINDQWKFSWKKDITDAYTFFKMRDVEQRLEYLSKIFDAELESQTQK